MKLCHVSQLVSCLVVCVKWCERCVLPCGQPFKGHRPSCREFNAATAGYLPMPNLCRHPRNLSPLSSLLCPTVNHHHSASTSMTAANCFSAPTMLLWHQEKKHNPCTHQDLLSLVPEILQGKIRQISHRAGSDKVSRMTFQTWWMGGAS